MGEPTNQEDDIIWDDKVYQKVWDGLKAKTQNNPDLAESLFLEAVKLGSTEALAELGVMYVERGEATYANRAIKLAISAGELGSLQKLAGLRWKGSAKISELVFEKGQDVFTSNGNGHRHWYKLAARLGHVGAATLLSLMESKSVDERKEWLYLLVEANDTAAMIELAEILFGENASEEAENLLDKANSLGSARRGKSLNDLEETKNRKAEYENICAMFSKGLDSISEGDTDRAEACWREVILYKGEDPFGQVLQSLDCLGVLLANKGELLEAVDFWCEAYRRSIAESYKQASSDRLKQAFEKAKGADLIQIEKKLHAVGLRF